MTKALESNGSRILTPCEADAIRSQIEKPSLRVLWDLLLYTGMRLAEVKQLRDNPDIFDQERRTLTIKSGKEKAKYGKRNVCLSDKGIEAVWKYLENPTVPSSPHVWQMNLIRWATRSRLAEIPGQAAISPTNPTGITARTTRKSWESWLLTAYPDKIVYITLSQGHTESTALRHYMNLSFTRDEKQSILSEVTGWGEC